jgi:CheY-like chemotaxis protein
MDSETLEHIFDPYFTTKEVGEGTGLGLSVVHGIVTTHNGVITVESEPGKGTTFHVYFPVIEKDAETQEEDQGPLPTGNERILFVDDEEVIVDIGEKTLGQLGYDVVTKTSSLEALELFRADPGRFDLVITDMTMPKMTGDQLARELMKIRPDIPIILCTGFSPKISGKRAKEIGIKAFAMKPLVRRDMANIVRKVLDAGKSKV